MLRHCQVTPGNAGNAKGNIGDANNTMPLPSHAGKTLEMLRETLGMPIMLYHSQVTPLNAGNTEGNTGSPIRLCHCQDTPGNAGNT